MTYRLLLVDDDQENVSINSALLRAHGYKVTTCDNGQKAIETFRSAKHEFALVLMDYHMPGMNGAEVIREIKRLKPDQQIIAFSLDDTREVMRETFRAGVVDFLDKNSDNEGLLGLISNCCAKYDQLYRKVASEHLDFDKMSAVIRDCGMVGRSKSLYQLACDIKKIGPTQATTLILGESGTGKELVAKALHQTSDRAKGPFVAVNIGAEPATLLDSSLFGHKKGAFTGATQDQPGKFQLAHRGTIFLDEIGDMSLDLQVKLLRVLQEREVHPVGALRPVHVDVRIVAATHKDLEKLVSEGKFREDLYYRLNSVIIRTTPLRERPEDVEPLLAHFTDQVCQENKFLKAFHRRCLDVLTSYTWRNNIRELRSVVESHLIRSESGIVRLDDLDPRLFQKPESIQPQTLDEIDAHVEGVKRDLVLDTIRRAGTKAEASRRLGVSQTRLHYFISKWKVGI